MYHRPALARWIFVAITLAVVLRAAAAEPLPSWNEGPAKKAIIDFVTRVTREGSTDYVRRAERIAVFDNDGTLWVEQPIYVQFAFAIDRVKTLAPQHPEWQKQPPFQAVINGDLNAVAASGEHGLLQIMAASHAGMTTEAYDAIVAAWIATAKHPRFARPYTQLVYQPMLEVLAYLRENGFKTFIVSGGGVDFMRVFSEQAYDIPPEQVVGSASATKFQMGADGKPVLIKQAQIEFVDDGPGKPSGINRFIGRRPIVAFGNSDGDLQMLQWTAAGSGARFLALIHHTDGEREYAYDRRSPVGRLDKALDEADARDWIVVDMKRDWRTIFPAQP